MSHTCCTYLCIHMSVTHQTYKLYDVIQRTDTLLCALSSGSWRRLSGFPTWGRSSNCSLLPRSSPRPSIGHLQGVWNVQGFWQAGRFHLRAQQRSDGLPECIGCHIALRVLFGSNSLHWRRPQLWWRKRCYSGSEKGRRGWPEETDRPTGGGGIRVDENGALWNRVRHFGRRSRGRETSGAQPVYWL